MTPADLRSARAILGEMWGLGRPLHYSELGRALQLRHSKPGISVRNWEQGDGPTGPASAAIEAWLDGARPRTPMADIVTRRVDGARV